MTYGKNEMQSLGHSRGSLHVIAQQGYLWGFVAEVWDLGKAIHSSLPVEILLKALIIRSRG